MHQPDKPDDYDDVPVWIWVLYILAVIGVFAVVTYVILHGAHP